MTTPIPEPSKSGAPAHERRPHDAAASRRALLTAARERFDELGYERATLRDIGERADVDPALVARYFGGKEGLFLAVMAEQKAEEPPVDPDPLAVAARVLEHWDCGAGGDGPVLQALVGPAPSPAVREQVLELLDERVLRPVAEELAGRGIADARLRAELLLAALVGIGQSRANGTLAALAGAPREQILEILAAALGRPAHPAPDRAAT
jgi:AcrR family transcriptional regulator